MEVCNALWLAVLTASWFLTFSDTVIQTEAGGEPAHGVSPAVERRGLAESSRNQVNRGFVFFGGRYLAPPYVVTRRGFDILINDIPVVDPNMTWLALEAER